MKLQETSLVSGCQPDQFALAVDILLRKPHSTNKRLVGSKITKYENETEFSIPENYLNSARNLILERKLVPKTGTDSAQFEKVEWESGQSGEAKMWRSRVRFSPMAPKAEFYVTCSPFEIWMEQQLGEEGNFLKLNT